MSISVSVIASVTLALVSFAAGKVFRANAFEVIMNIVNSFLLYVIIPIVIFDSIAGAENLLQFSAAVVVSLLHILAMFILSYSLARLFRSMRASFPVTFALCLAMPNAGFLAIPLASIVMGRAEHIVPYTIAFNISLPIIVAMLSYMKRNSRKNTATFSTSLLFIFVVIASLLLRILSVDLDDIYTYVHKLSSLSLLSFAIIGYELSRISLTTLKIYLHQVIAASILRYVASPMIALAMARPNIIGYSYAVGILFQSIMPPAVSIIVLAKAYRLDTELTALMVTIMTLTSIALAPIIYHLSPILIK